MRDLDRLWVGIVEENIDPDRLGRVKIRVQSIFDNMPVEDIPWAHPVKTLTGCAFEIPAIGKLVSVFFPNDNIYEPYYMYSDHYNVNLQKKLKDYSDDEYPNFSALFFDHKTKIFSDDKNLTMDYLYNRITIDNDNINLELKDNQRKVNIGTKSASQQAVLGNHFFDWFDKLVNKLVEPTSMMGNMGAPILKPEIDLLLVEYQTLRETFISDHVYIVDDNKVDKLNMPYNSPIVDDGVKINATPVAGNNPGATDVNNQVLSDKIKQQKNKELEILKNAIPSDAKEEYATADNPEENALDNDYAEYKEIVSSTGEEIPITKERYEDIKTRELTESELSTYDIVEWQEDADLMIYQLKYDDTDIDILTEEGYAYTAPDDTVYTDTSETISTPKLSTNTNSGVSTNCKDINTSTWGYDMKLSTHFTLADLSTKTVYPYRIPDVKKAGDIHLTKYGIACNLKALAIDVLEPIWKECNDKKLGMLITSAFRNKNNSTSQHEKGQAVDIQFTKLKKNQYINMATWIYNNVPFDQLLFEHRDATSVWIHISYNSKGNRPLSSKTPKYATFYNDKTYKRLAFSPVDNFRYT